MTATLEDLERVPAGAVVTVDGTPWERVDNGLARLGTVLTLDHFTGYLASNRIVMPVVWHEGAYYTIGGGQQTRYVTSVADGTAHFLVFRNGRGEVSTESCPEGEIGEWIEVRSGSERIWHRRVRGVHDLIAGRVHESKVRITGHTYWTPTLQASQQFMGDQVLVTDIDDCVTIHWSREVRIANTGEGCTCEQVDRAALEQYLPTEYESWEFVVDCV
jgi:hypothetical protein